MRKFCLVLIILFLANASFAQKLVSKYYSECYDKFYGIYESGSTFLIDVHSEGNESDPVRIRILCTNYLEFINSMKATRDKFASWIDVAKENGIDHIVKEMDIHFPAVWLTWISTRRWVNGDLELKPKFLVQEGKPFLFFSTNVLKGRRHQEFTLIFSSVREMDDFIYALLYREGAPDDVRQDELFK